MTIRVKIDRQSLVGVNAFMRATPARVYPPMRRELTNWATDWQAGVRSRFTGKTGPNSLRSRSGDLSGSIRHIVTGSSLDDLRVEMFSAGLNYSRLHEYGGTITPKHGTWLMWPVEPGPAVKPSGQASYPSARSFIERHPGQTVFRRAKTADTLLLFLNLVKAPEKKARRIGPIAPGEFVSPVPRGKFVGPIQTSKLAYIGKKKVTIPARLGFFETWRQLRGKRSEGLARLAASLGGRA